MASTSNPEYSLSKYFPVVSYEAEDGNVEESIDFFNPDGAAFVNSLTSNRSFTWNPSLRLDVLAHRQFNSVSAWWLTLFFDGSHHVGELRTGSFISVPQPARRLQSSISRSPGRGSRVRL